MYHLPYKCNNVTKVTVVIIILLLAVFRQYNPGYASDFVIDMIQGKCLDCDHPYHLSRVQFIDSHRGWAQGSWISTEGQGAGTSTLLHTVDGGYTWTQFKFIKQHVAEEKLPFSFITAQKGWVSWEDENNSRNHIIRTIDGGNTWQTVEYSSPKRLTEVKFFNEKIGYATRFSLDSGSDFAITKDGGITWTAKQLPVKYIKSMYFATPQIGWILGVFEIEQSRLQSCILKTVNSGQTWVALQPDKNYSANIEDMFWFNQDVGWLVVSLQNGKGSYVLKTDDGGDTWRQMLIKEKNMTLVRFVSDKRGFAFYQAGVGDQNQLLVTNDGGDNWKDHNLGVSVSYCQVLHGELWCTCDRNILNIKPNNLSK